MPHLIKYGGIVNQHIQPPIGVLEEVSQPDNAGVIIDVQLVVLGMETFFLQSLHSRLTSRVIPG